MKERIKPLTAVNEGRIIDYAGEFITHNIPWLEKRIKEITGMKVELRLEPKKDRIVSMSLMGKQNPILDGFAVGCNLTFDLEVLKSPNMTRDDMGIIELYPKIEFDTKEGADIEIPFHWKKLELNLNEPFTEKAWTEYRSAY